VITSWGSARGYIWNCSGAMRISGCNLRGEGVSATGLVSGLGSVLVKCIGTVVARTFKTESPRWAASCSRLPSHKFRPFVASLTDSPEEIWCDYNRWPAQCNVSRS
jgi:hypothetical protein